jgi:hypothetical protein
MPSSPSSVSALLPHSLHRIASGLRGAAAWCEGRPRLAACLAALVVLLLVGTEVSYWPLNDFPGATWHNTPRGDDVEIGQARAAQAGPRELLGFWTGDWIMGNHYYRPLTSSLYVAEYRLFGTNDRLWARVNIAVHLGVVVLLLTVGALAVEGPLLVRLAVGAGAALLFGGPRLADRSTQAWMLGWWPSQPDLLSLFFGLLLLAATLRYCRAGGVGWAALAGAALLLGAASKEMAYLAAAGACLILLPHRKRWPLLAALLGVAVLAWVARTAALAGDRATPLAWSGARALRTLTAQGGDLQETLRSLGFHLGLFAVPFFLTWPLRRRYTGVGHLVIATAGYLVFASGLLGPPWEQPFSQDLARLSRFAAGTVLLAGTLLAARRWPAPALILMALLATGFAWGLNPVFGYYRYWSTGLTALVTALALRELVILVGRLETAATTSRSLPPETQPA